MTRQISHPPLAYSWSGCSSVAELANTPAVRLDREGEAEMSCIAGVGASLPGFVARRAGRPILALDGCPLVCVRNCLKRHGIAPDRYVQLQQHGVKKRYGQDPAHEDVEHLYPWIVTLARQIRPDHRQRQEKARSTQAGA
jgi:uncharacterized metal-binding protein